MEIWYSQQFEFDASFVKNEIPPIENKGLVAGPKMNCIITLKRSVVSILYECHYLMKKKGLLFSKTSSRRTHLIGIVY